MAKTVIRGVNLGGWLVLEPWITPSLFKGTDAPDEFTFCDGADARRLKRLIEFRETFITQDDFQWLADQGINAVRIPVGHWAFGDVKPYAGTIEYLDRAFEWAENAGLKVLVCLHGVPGSQNGEMHSGRKGDIGWHTDAQNIEQSLKTVERLAECYADKTNLLGIELLNEPSTKIPRRILMDYYRRGYKLVRKICGSDTWVVIGDYLNPRPWRWQLALHWPFYRNAYLDTHQYQVFDQADKLLDLAGHLSKTTGAVARLVRLTALHRKVIVGEWSAALDSASLKGLKGVEADKACSDYCQAQAGVYDTADAWFYWTYRTENGGPWSYRAMVEKGLFPHTREEL